MPSASPDPTAPRRRFWQPFAASPATTSPAENPRLSPLMWLVVATLIIAFGGDLFRYTIGWTGYGILVVLAIGLLAVALIRQRRPLRLKHLPLALLTFMLWCAITAVWSLYRLETIAGSIVQILTALAGLAIALTLTRFQFIRALGVAMRFLVYVSLAFELVMGIWFTDGILPPIYWRPGTLETLLGTTEIPEPLPGGFYWSHGDLFEGGPIQGVMGNRNLLAMVALLALIVTVVELADRLIGRIRAILAIGASLLAIAFTTSATVVIALAFVIFGVGLLWFGRRLRRRWRWTMYAVVGTGLVVGSYVAIAFNNEIFAAMNRSPDMSGRGSIWRAVIDLGAQAPVLGNGWISYWAPWIPEFSSLAVVEGMAYHQAHNAFLDVWMQTGFVGLALFIGLVFTTFIRTWWIAIDKPSTPVIQPIRTHGHEHLSASTAAPFLIMVALVVQAMTESRILVEGGWVLLVYFAIYSKLRMQDISILPRHTVPTRTGAITVLIDPRRDP